jgi:uncharacterized protein (DUF433 family)
MQYIERITIDPLIAHGKPCIRGMRWPVIVVLDMEGSGMTYNQVLEDHPELEIEDICAAINYAALYMSKSIKKEVA